MVYGHHQMTGLLKGLRSLPVRIVPAVMVTFQIVMTQSHVLMPFVTKSTVENMDDGHRQKRQRF